jgi:deoxyribodipyrimidine photolyase
MSAARPKALIWHRRDMRLGDNASLAAALDQGFEPVGVFVFDTDLLAGLE